MNERVLCRLEDIPDGGSAGFALPGGSDPTRLMALRRQQRVFVYVNVCPHWGAPLDVVPGRFLDADRRHILCATHGAIFRIEDGQCVRGPCLGAQLTPVAARVADGLVLVEPAASQPTPPGLTLRA